MTYKKSISDKARKPLPGVAVPVDLAIEKIKKHRGVLAHAADEIGCTRHTLQEMINRVPEVKDAVKEARERLIDLVEETYIDKAIQGDSYNGAFVLKTLGRSRGYDVDSKETNNLLMQVVGFVMNKSKSPVEE